MRYNANWASHLPILIKVMGLSDGPVLEMGMGPFSTPVLHWLCLDKKRLLVSYENNSEYYKQNESFRTDMHEISFVDDWEDKALNLITRHWGVVFIDHAPADRRILDIEKLANSADYIIIHDSEESQNNHYNYKKIYPLFKYRYDYKKQKPYTTVLSNFKDLNILSK